MMVLEKIRSILDVVNVVLSFNQQSPIEDWLIATLGRQRSKYFKFLNIC